MSGFAPLLHDIFASAHCSDTVKRLDRTTAAIEPYVRAMAVAAVSITEACKTNMFIDPSAGWTDGYKSFDYNPRKVALEGVTPPHGKYTQWLTFLADTGKIVTWQLSPEEVQYKIGTPVCELRVERYGDRSGPAIIIGVTNEGNISITQRDALLRIEGTKEIPLAQAADLPVIVGKWIRDFFGEHTVAEAKKAADTQYAQVTAHRLGGGEQNVWGTPFRLTA